MAYAAVRAAVILCALRAAAGVAYVAVTPRGDGMHVVAVLASANSAPSVTVLVTDATGAVLLNSTTSTAGQLRTDVGTLSRQAQSALAITTVSAGLTQHFAMDTRAAAPLLGLVWVPAEGSTRYTLTPIPANWFSPYARWSVQCDGAPLILQAPWANRTVDASSTAQCIAQVTMDSTGFVISDVLEVQGGGFALAAAPSSGCASMRASLMAVLPLSLLATSFRELSYDFI